MVVLVISRPLSKELWEEFISYNYFIIFQKCLTTQLRPALSHGGEGAGLVHGKKNSKVWPQKYSLFKVFPYRSLSLVTFNIEDTFLYIYIYEYILKFLKKKMHNAYVINVYPSHVSNLKLTTLPPPPVPCNSILSRWDLFYWYKMTLKNKITTGPSN